MGINAKVASHIFSSLSSVEGIMCEYYSLP